jgi:hypothetical protein
MDKPQIQRHDPLGAWIASVVREFCAGPENRLQNAAGDRAWDAPLVGIARGDDPLFERYKEAVGPFHWTPWEALADAYSGTTATPRDLAVICWILPQTAATKADNRAEVVYPAERWARSRIFGEQFNARLRQHVVAELRARGYQAAAPAFSPRWSEVASDRYVYASTWSERHAAYACGLGTFGLCDGLITSVGKAVRIGSVVAQIEVPPTPRPYQQIQPTAHALPTGAAVSVSPAARPAPLPMPGTTRCCALPTWRPPARTCRRTMALTAMAAGCARRACRASREYRPGSPVSFSPMGPVPWGGPWGSASPRGAMPCAQNPYLA